MKRERFNELLQMLLDDDMATAQMDELTEIVAVDDELLKQLREHLLISDRLSQYEDKLRSDERFLDAVKVRIRNADDSERFVNKVVASIYEGLPSGPPIASVENSRRRWESLRGLAGWGVAAVVLAVMAIALPRQRGQQSIPVVENTLKEVSDSGVAVLTLVSNLSGERSADLVTGKTISPGAIQWDGGLLQFEFYSGATMVVEGPAKIEVLDEYRVVCRSGRIRTHVPEPARGFTVLTSTFELVDLGTEFGVEVSDDGAAEVHVFDGKVELYEPESNRDVATRRELNAGDVVAVDHDGTSKPSALQDADFVTPIQLNQLNVARRGEQLKDWRAFRDSLKNDPRVVAYFPFDIIDAEDRLLIGYGANGSEIKGAIVGCEWSKGRWPDKTSLQFKRPADRVRIEVPGEFESLTYSAWLRLDGLDRAYNSLLLTDGFAVNGIHWQIRQEGVLALGVKGPENDTYSYWSESIFNLFGLGQWVHLATVYDNEKAHVEHYVNGQLATREPLQQKLSGMFKIGNATIGNWSFPPEDAPKNKAKQARQVRNLNGCIDEFIVFGVALDPKEVQRIYEVGRP